MREGEAFLKSKWPWVLKTRAKVLAKSAAVRLPVTQEELAALRTTLAELNAKWAARVGEEGVAWKIKDVKSLWGCCHWPDRYIVYNSESTIRNSPVRRANWSSLSSCTSMRTFTVRGHGSGFRRLMDERLPGWKGLRRRLNGRGWTSCDDMRADGSAQGAVG